MLLGKLIFSAATCFFLSSISFASEPKLIDLDRVSPVVKKHLVKIGADQFTSPKQFTLSFDETFSPQGLEYNHMAFIMNRDRTEVWNAYLNANPKKAWSGKMIEFDLGYSKKTGEVYYRNSEFIPSIHEGMGFFIVLNLYHLKKLPATLEISKIDSENHQIEFTYLSTNTSHGKQIVTFADLGGGRTLVVHDSYFRSKSKFRDKALYPPIHEALLEEFHQNVMNTIDLPIQRVD